MGKAILFVVALVFSIATCSQSGGRGQVACETKHSIFFADGSLDEYTESEWDNKFTHVEAEKKYSASGTMLEQVEFAYNDDKGWKTAKITRDVESRLKNRVVYQYNDQGRLWRESIVDSKGKVSSTYEYGYDSRGNQISRLIKNRTGDPLAETTYTYDSAGRMTMSETKNAGGARISSTKYTYDSQGNLTNTQVFSGDGRVTQVTSSVFQGGREVKNETATPDGNVTMRVTNEYGSKSELAKKTIENIQGASKQVIRYEYHFK